MIKHNKKNNIIKISVIGGSKVDTDIYQLAYRVGREIARKEAVLICGGLTGIMEAACKGAKKEGGLTIGILPTQNENDANEYVDIVIPTGMGYARNVSIILSAHAVIAINGSYGTLSEISYTLTYKKPIIGLKTWDAQPYYSENTPFIIRAETAEEAVRIAMKEAKNYIKKNKNPV
jgi:uncharacterized protein (TIGR00725 family)